MDVEVEREKRRASLMTAAVLDADVGCLVRIIVQLCKKCYIVTDLSDAYTDVHGGIIYIYICITPPATGIINQSGAEMPIIITYRRT